MLGTNYGKTQRYIKRQAACGPTFCAQTKLMLGFWGKCEGKRQLGRPMYKWEDKTKHTSYKSRM